RLREFRENSISCCEQRRTRRVRQRELRHLAADSEVARLAVPFDNAFLYQRMDDPMYGRPRQPGCLHDLGERQSSLAAGGQNAQHGNRAADRLRAFPRFHKIVPLSTMWTASAQINRQVRSEFE